LSFLAAQTKYTQAQPCARTLRLVNLQALLEDCLVMLNHRFDDLH
jgi:hypothetical protein